MSEIVKILPYCVNLNEAIKTTELHTIFVMGDKQAHRFEIEITRGNVPESLDGCTVVGKFVNFKENTSIKFTGKVEGGKAVVTLSDPCYALRGQFVLMIQIHSGGSETTVFLGEGYMRNSSTDTIIYNDYVVMDADTLLDHIAAMDAGTNRANAAADRVERMQIDASGLAGDANRLGGKAPEYYTRPRKLLDNSDFTNPINQRGVTSGSAGTYLIDRWMAFGDSASISSSEEGSTISGRLMQRVPISYFKNGKPYTVALYYSDGTTASGWGTLNTSLLGQYADVARDADTTVQLSIRGSSEYLEFTINPEKTLRGAALYEGRYTPDTLPEYAPKEYVQELLACQQYCITFEPNDTWDTVLANGYSGGSVARFTIDLAVPMANEHPSIHIPEGHVFMVGELGENKPIDSLVVQRALGNKLYLQANGSFTTNHASTLKFYATSAGLYKKIVVSADLL